MAITVTISKYYKFICTTKILAFYIVLNRTQEIYTQSEMLQEKGRKENMSMHAYERRCEYILIWLP